jgi:dTDP-4-dehydrorhamnose reductase
VKVAVLGANGMLGSRVVEEFKRAGHDVTAYTRKELDLRELSDMSKTVRLAEKSFDWIVNCAGIVKSEAHKDLVDTVLVNSVAPHLLTERTGARLLQVSTDCVFDGMRGDYSEMDAPHPVDFYGATKLAGETLLNGSVVVRTSFIGWENGTKRGLLEWFVNQQYRPERRVVGYDGVRWSGLSAREVARALSLMIEQATGFGLYHLSGEVVSKYYLLSLLRKALSLDIGITQDFSNFCDRSLDGTKFCRHFDYQPPTWEQMAEELASERAK